MLRSLMVFSCLGLLAQAKRCDLLHRSVHRGHRNHPQDEQANTTLSASDESDGGYASSPAQPSFASGGYSGQASYKSSTAVDAPTFSQDAETASASASGSAGSSNSSDAATSGGMDGFPKRLYIDFSSASKGSDAERLLNQAGLQISTTTIGAGDAPLARQHLKENVQIGDGQLEMTTQAYSGSGPVKAAEIHSEESFLYGSARVVLKSTTVPGICIGHFYYFSDNQETDIELLTSSALKASSDNVPEGVWYTNQATSSDAEATDEHDPYGFDPAEDFHEYRIDWTEEYTAFFIDGEQRAKFTENVATEPSQYMLNGWSNGAPGWSAGPPTEDATFAVKSIEVLYRDS